MTDVWSTYTPWNADSPEVQKTASGLQYIVVKSGDASGANPKPSDMVRVHYDGRLASNGEKFDSSYDRGAPADFPAGRLISGWVEALGMMHPGDEWMLYIPSDLGYGSAGAGGAIPPNADLIFRVELLDIL